MHTIRANGSCHPRDTRRSQCEHERHAGCETAHRSLDSALGQPLCGECYDYVGHVLFSWHAPELWRRFTIRLRRLLRQQLRTRGENPDDTRVSFMKVVELQRRGLPHFHAVVRLDAATEPGQPPSPPDTRFSGLDLIALVRHAVAEIEIAATDDRIIRFGDQLDTKLIGPGDIGAAENVPTSSRKIARYLAKYVTKSVADIGVGVRRFSPAAIDELDVSDHVRSILTTIVDVANQEPYTDMLSWLHTLGYRGYVISKSRQFSTTMTALRERRAAWRKEEAQRDVTPGTSQIRMNLAIQWEFESLGHTSLGDRVLAISAFGRGQQQRFAARDALKEDP